MTPDGCLRCHGRPLDWINDYFVYLQNPIVDRNSIKIFNIRSYLAGIYLRKQDIPYEHYLVLGSCALADILSIPDKMDYRLTIWKMPIALSSSNDITLTRVLFALADIFTINTVGDKWSLHFPSSYLPNTISIKINPGDIFKTVPRRILVQVAWFSRVEEGSCRRDDDNTREINCILTQSVSVGHGPQWSFMYPSYISNIHSGRNTSLLIMVESTRLFTSCYSGFYNCPIRDSNGLHQLRGSINRPAVGRRVRYNRSPIR